MENYNLSLPVSGQSDTYLPIVSDGLSIIKCIQYKGYLSISLSTEDLYSLDISNEKIKDMAYTLNNINTTSIKENFYITAIRNLIKKAQFLQLVNQLSEKGITEEDFEKELEFNSSKYIIETNYLSNNTDIFILSEIVESIGSELSVDDVAEMFSFEFNSLNKSLKNALLLH